MRKIKLAQVDAFTDQLFGGNPAGVVFNADELTEDEMKKIAREMNLSETAFILSPSTNADLKLRFFTSGSYEIKFCGHATIGALYEAARENMFGMDKDGEYDLEIETNVGVLDANITKNNGEINIIMSSSKIDLQESKYSHSEISQLMGIDLNAIDTRYPVMEEKTLNYIYFTIKSLSDLGDLKFDFGKIKENFKEDNFVVFCLLTPETFDPENKVHARGLAPLVGVDEDPVTGSMQGTMGAYLLQNKILPEDTKEIGSEQGHFVHRPGSLKIMIERDGMEYKAKFKATAKHVFLTEIEL